MTIRIQDDDEHESLKSVLSFIQHGAQGVTEGTQPKLVLGHLREAARLIAPALKTYEARQVTDTFLGVMGDMASVDPEAAADLLVEAGVDIGQAADSIQEFITGLRLAAQEKGYTGTAYGVDDDPDDDLVVPEDDDDLDDGDDEEAAGAEVAVQEDDEVEEPLRPRRRRRRPVKEEA